MSDPRDAPRDLGNLADGEFARVYDQLRAVARRMLLDQKPGHTLQATALVHEAWLRLLRSGSPGVDGEGHFHRLAAVAMRHILIDHARRRGRQKRGGPVRRLSLDAVELASEDRTDDILDVDAAIERLRAAEPELAELVQLRFFAGLKVEEVAVVLGRPLRTLYRDWDLAKAMLLRELRVAGE
ncbi:MAG: sigma-70 family RNA polymerase sigma factor [Planctomycetes bacterium]|nr:sigma-70 family RNA polymerase sigma factor [Planctomycetota bacterium]